MIVIVRYRASIVDRSYVAFDCYIRSIKVSVNGAAPTISYTYYSLTHTPGLDSHLLVGAHQINFHLIELNYLPQRADAVCKTPTTQ